MRPVTPPPLPFQFGDHLLDRAARGELNDDEVDGDDAEQRRDHQQQAADQVGAHQACCAGAGRSEIRTRKGADGPDPIDGDWSGGGNPDPSTTSITPSDHPPNGSKGRRPLGGVEGRSPRLAYGIMARCGGRRRWRLGFHWVEPPTVEYARPVRTGLSGRPKRSQ